MRKKSGIMALCLMLCLMGCGKQERTYAESCWESISYSTELDEYVAENAGGLDMEALQSEAGDEESPLSRQFMATVLLCAAEHGKQADEYPISAPYADAFLKKVLTEEENFWKALGEVSYFESLFPLLLNASNELDGDLMVKLLMGIPEDSDYKYRLRKELDKWLEQHPAKMLAYGDELIAAGYFDGWTGINWSSVFFGKNLRADSVDDALKYVADLKNTILPAAQNERNPALIVVTSKHTGEDYLQTTMMIGISQELTLQEPGDGDLPEEIVTEGKKLVALYRNPHGDEFPDSPEPLRLKGDFMLNLPAQQYPASMEDADYYLILTPSYEYGDFYQYDNGKDSNVRMVFSTTSIDLYEAGTGRFLRHLGNVIEEPSQRILINGYDDKLQYPGEVKADILYYIYSHINDPDAYVALVDHIGGQTEFERNETIIIGQWEITYHANEIADTFGTGRQYTAAEGNRFIKAEFTITNRGNDSASLFSVNSGSWEYVNIYLFDYANETVYDCTNQDRFYLGVFGQSSLGPGESQTGDLVFEVKHEALRNIDYLFIAVNKGKQTLLCPLGP